MPHQLVHQLIGKICVTHSVLEGVAMRIECLSSLKVISLAQKFVKALGKVVRSSVITIPVEATLETFERLMADAN